MSKNNGKLWNGAPPWAKWAAKSQAGSVKYFSHEPVISGACWIRQRNGDAPVGKYGWAQGKRAAITGEWTESLRKRPSPTPRKAGKRVRAWAFVAICKDGLPFEVRVIGRHTKRQANKSRITMKYTGVGRHLSNWDVGALARISLPLPTRKSRKGGGK